jgi:hypothetical protein
VAVPRRRLCAMLLLWPPACVTQPTSRHPTSHVLHHVVSSCDQSNHQTTPQNQTHTHTHRSTWSPCRCAWRRRTPCSSTPTSQRSSRRASQVRRMHARARVCVRVCVCVCVPTPACSVRLLQACSAVTPGARAQQCCAASPARQTEPLHHPHRHAINTTTPARCAPHTPPARPRQRRARATCARASAWTWSWSRGTAPAA